MLGSGTDVLPLVTTARSLGWLVTVWGTSESFESRARLVLAGATVELDLVRVRAGQGFLSPCARRPRRRR